MHVGKGEWEGEGGRRRWNKMETMAALKRKVGARIETQFDPRYEASTAEVGSPRSCSLDVNEMTGIVRHVPAYSRSCSLFDRMYNALPACTRRLSTPPSLLLGLASLLYLSPLAYFQRVELSFKTFLTLDYNAHLARSHSWMRFCDESILSNRLRIRERYLMYLCIYSNYNWFDGRKFYLAVFFLRNMELLFQYDIIWKH